MEEEAVANKPTLNPESQSLDWPTLNAERPAAGNWVSDPISQTPKPTKHDKPWAFLGLSPGLLSFLHFSSCSGSAHGGRLSGVGNWAPGTFDPTT